MKLIKYFDSDLCNKISRVLGVVFLNLRYTNRKQFLINILKSALIIDKSIEILAFFIENCIQLEGLKKFVDIWIVNDLDLLDFSSHLNENEIKKLFKKCYVSVRTFFIQESILIFDYLIRVCKSLFKI